MTTEELILRVFEKEKCRTVIVSCEEKDLLKDYESIKNKFIGD